MDAELVLYRDSQPAIQDGLLVDDELFRCTAAAGCTAEYRIHYSAGVVNKLDDLRASAQEAVNGNHRMLGDHDTAIPL